jgi:hypothetical protein
VVEWYFIGGLAMAFALLATRGAMRKRSQEAVADASGLVPVGDLTHLPETLQRTALWSLADGGFERRPVHGVVSRGTEDIDVTAFDLETLRERRGEWAYLPVDPSFRIGGVVSVVACEVDREFPHVLLKRAGHGDDNADDDPIERAGSLAKAARDGLGMPRSYAAELPPGLAPGALDVALPAQWRASGDRTVLAELAGAGLGVVLERAGRRDLVIELLGSLVVVYPAARGVAGADAFADLTATALALVDGVLARSPRVSPRGMEARRAEHGEGERGEGERERGV